MLEGHEVSTGDPNAAMEAHREVTDIEELDIES